MVGVATSTARLDSKRLYAAADVVFLSPPWGGPEYVKSEVFGVAKDIGGLGVGLAGLLALALWVVDRGGPRAAPRMWGVAVFLPRNASLVEIADEVGALRRQGLLAEDRHEVEECWVSAATAGNVPTDLEEARQPPVHPHIDRR